VVGPDPKPPARAETPVLVFPDARALGEALAAEIASGIDRARNDGGLYILGCPGGRSARSTYEALARRLNGSDLRHLVIAMMDEYLLENPDGALVMAPAGAHYSCRRFAEVEIAGPLRAASGGTGPTPEHVWLPEPSDPEAYERRLAETGGVDLFIVASGAGDGHVAFNPPGSPLDGGGRIIPLAETTRRDNMATFPEFRSLDEVPGHGVSVGLGTIARVSRSVRLVMLGEGKRQAAERVLGTHDFDPGWPATFIHGCPDPQIWLDAAAHPGGAGDRLPAVGREQA
jgi:glucosamine-6-phosphate deaminase